MNLEQTLATMVVLGVASATIGCANDRMNTGRGASTATSRTSANAPGEYGPADRGMSATNSVGGASKQSEVEGGDGGGAGGGGGGGGAGGG